MQAEQKRSSGYLSGVTQWLPSVVPATLQGLSSYVPDPVRVYFPAAPLAQSLKEQIIYSSFYESSGFYERRIYLLLGMSSGFQVWDLKEMKEAYSKRDAPTRSIHMWEDASPRNPESGLNAFFSILSTGDDPSFPRNHIKVFSIQKGDYVERIRFETEIYSVCTTTKFMFVSLKDKIHGISMESFKSVMSFPCYPNIPPSLHDTAMPARGVFAISTRWIAYASTTSATKHRDMNHESDAIYSLAKDFANGIYALGDMGARKVNSILMKEPVVQVAQSPELTHASRMEANSGIVIIRDMETQEIIAHFAAHEKPLSLLKFNPSGTLLATVSVSGNHINIFKINPGNASNSVHHLYRFSRGMISAQIHDVSFSADSKWLTVLSTRGTAHIFGLNPQGGVATPESHVRNEKSKVGHYRQRKSSFSCDARTVAGSPLARIKDLVSFPSPNQQGCPSGVFMYGVNPNVSLLLLSNSGRLFHYKLHPRLASKTDPDPYALMLDMSEPAEWDVGRCSDWKELTEPSSISSCQPVKGEPSASSWTEQIEVASSNHFADYIQSGHNINFFVFSQEGDFKQDSLYESISSCLLQTRQSEPIPSFWNESDLLIEIDEAAPYQRGESNRRLVKDPRDELLVAQDTPTQPRRQLAPVIMAGQPSLEQLLLHSYMHGPTRSLGTQGAGRRAEKDEAGAKEPDEDEDEDEDDSLGRSPARAAYVGPVAAFGQRRHSTSSSLSDDAACESDGRRLLGQPGGGDCDGGDGDGDDDVDGGDGDDDDGAIQTIGDRMERMGHAF